MSGNLFEALHFGFLRTMSNITDGGSSYISEQYILHTSHYHHPCLSVPAGSDFNCLSLSLTLSLHIFTRSTHRFKSVFWINVGSKKKWIKSLHLFSAGGVQSCWGDDEDVCSITGFSSQPLFIIKILSKKRSWNNQHTDCAMTPYSLHRQALADLCVFVCKWFYTLSVV